ncbi:MAG: hypothetical protein DRQ55_14335 [Planctomycetota bacterium]|nr:MAG: hypothetical protein DRQ55_14335 [Planctomycetota bacterium]
MLHLPAPGATTLRLARRDATQHGQRWSLHMRTGEGYWCWLPDSGGRISGSLCDLEYPYPITWEQPPIPLVALTLEPEVGRAWLAAIASLPLRYGPSPAPATVIADVSPDAIDPHEWDARLTQALVPWAQVMQGGRQARLGLSTEDGRVVFQLQLPANGIRHFEQDLASSLDGLRPIHSGGPFTQRSDCGPTWARSQGWR